MLKRPERIMSGTCVKVLPMRNKFNAALEECVATLNDSFHLVSIEVHEADFDLSGGLTSFGKTTFWKELNRGLKKFDKGEITLKPCKPSKGDSKLTPSTARSTRCEHDKHHSETKHHDRRSASHSSLRHHQHSSSRRRDRSSSWHRRH